MRKYPLLLTVFVITVIVGCARSTDVASIDGASTDVAGEPSTAAPATGTGRFYAVDDYDPQRDAKADLLMTIEQAKASNKRIILEIGGQW
jgi:hypothetical protein